MYPSGPVTGRRVFVDRESKLRLAIRAMDLASRIERRNALPRCIHRGFSRCTTPPYAAALAKPLGRAARL
jgi:hypothetical protein